jgi:hypothetical protein
MSTVKILNVLKHFGTNSIRELFRQTGSSEHSVFRQAQIAAIEAMYRINKGFRGPFGFPLDDVEFNGNTAVRFYSGGQIGSSIITRKAET